MIICVLARRIKIRTGPSNHIRAAFGGIGAAANLLLGLYFCALGILGLIAAGDLFVPLVPVSPENAAVALLLLGLFAVIASLFAISGGKMLRIPLLVWAVALFLALAAAVFRSDYRFDGIEDFKTHGLLLMGSLVLVYASWVRFKTPPPRRPSY